MKLREDMENKIETIYTSVAKAIKAHLISEAGDGDASVLVKEPWKLQDMSRAVEEELSEWKNLKTGASGSWLKKYKEDERVIHFSDGKEENVVLTNDSKYFREEPSWVMFKLVLGPNKNE